MIEFCTLGSLGLRGLDSTDCRAILSQPKRVALLAYLAIATPRGFHRRDTLLAMFWPDLDSDHARASLRKALHFLRQHMQNDVLEKRGDAVGLNSRLISCDAVAFEKASESGCPEAALALYGGDLLRGLHVSSTPDFERWLERERGRLRTWASEAAWELAIKKEKAGDWVSAADHARRAATLSPELEGAVRRVIRLLDRAGDRAAAVREYETFAKQLADEYDLEPSGETKALIQAVRVRAEMRSPITASTRTTVRPTTAEPKVIARSVGVLPFLSIGLARETEHLADGITEDVITHLSKIPDLKVISRTSTMRYKNQTGKSLREIGEELSVAALLEGSVQQAEGHVRVAAQLIDATADEHLWAETYDRKLSNVFAIQSDIALQIARALDVGLSPTVRSRIESRPTRNVEAHSLYLQGRYAWNMRTRDGVSRAIECYERAIAADPGFALAYVGLAECHAVRPYLGGLSMAQGFRDARTAALAALDLDGALGAARATLGSVIYLSEGDAPGAEEEFKRSIQLSPSYATTHHWYGVFLGVQGRFDEAFSELHRALELDPLSPTIRNDIAVELFRAGRDEEALSQFRTVVEISPEYWRAHHDLGITYGALGRLEEAVVQLLRAWELGAFGTTKEEAETLRRTFTRSGWRAVLDQKLELLKERRKREHVIALEPTMICALLDRRDETFQWLEETCEDWSLAMVMRHDRLFDRLQDDPRFRTLMEKGGFDMRQPHGVRSRTSNLGRRPKSTIADRAH